MKVIKLILILTFLFIFVSCSDLNTNNSIEATSTEPIVKSTPNEDNKSNEIKEDTTNTEYKLIEVDGGNQSGHREPNVMVDIGFGDREYYAYTNEYGQLVKVTADKIILQDDTTEPVTSNGRYYSDEAKIPGVESPTLDEGHVIADALGGVSNAYNITPQDSTLNRHGDQAYMEKMIREAGGCTNFTAIITYPNNETQIPNHYSYTYTLKGNTINDEFDNVNPDETNKKIIVPTNTSNDKEVATLKPTLAPTQKKSVETSKQLTANVKLVSANKTLNNTHVGHEWSYSVKVNNKEINLGETISVSGTINAQATAVENDSVPDEGTNSKNLVAGKNVIKVTVTENRGRYSGEIEVWEFVLNVQYK